MLTFVWPFELGHVQMAAPCEYDISSEFACIML